MKKEYIKPYTEIIYAGFSTHILSGSSLTEDGLVEGGKEGQSQSDGQGGDIITLSKQNNLWDDCDE